MLKAPLATIFFAIALLATLPASAADDIASRVQICATCHGQAGKPINTATPIIWGQKANWLYKELHDYHSGARDNATMAPVAKSFSFEDLRAMADYFAAKTWPTAAAPVKAAAATKAPESAAMCKACHGQNFEGGDPAPRLAGLSYTYLISAMNGFADGKRTNNLDMPGFMKALTKSQREAIAHYLATL
jgi:cytochrome c553